MTSELWKELHIQALMRNGAKEDRVFLSMFSHKVPKFGSGCNCSNFWMIYQRTNPPRFGNEFEYFIWTVEVHNAVNAKLGKRVLDLEEAIDCVIRLI